MKVVVDYDRIFALVESDHLRQRAGDASLSRERLELPEHEHIQPEAKLLEGDSETLINDPEVKKAYLGG